MNPPASPDVTAPSVPSREPPANPDTGLTAAEVEVRRNEHGYNEVAVGKAHPVRQFLGKFWGVSAWMLELIIILSAVLGNYSDRIVA